MYILAYALYLEPTQKKMKIIQAAGGGGERKER